MRDDKNKLFVGNLSFEVSNEKLEEIFNDVEGVKVKEATIVMDRDSGRSRGFAFVTVEDGAMVDKAIEALNGKEIDGRNVTVKQAQPRENRGGGYRGGYQQNNYQSGGRRY